MRNAIRSIVLFMTCALFLGLSMSYAGNSSEVPSEIPVKGMVTMLDLGANSCIPCKMMAPIIEELQKEYSGKASIIFIDVWKNRDEAGKYGIRAIPTQIFYDKTGKEAHRHVGFMDKQSIIQVLEELGVK